MAQRKFLAVMFLFFCCATSEALIEDILDSSNVKTVLSAIQSFSSVFFRPPPNFKVNFSLYSRIQPDKPHHLVLGDKENLTKSTFDPIIPTKIIIHGFFDNIHISNWMFRLRDELLHEGSCNVIIVDWSNGNGPPYSEAVKNAKHAGGLVADLIEFLQNASGADPKDFHLIGHSLGSQVAAVAGHRVRHLGRISGLDPAGPSFYDAPLNDRLDPSDADFVDVIHTDSGRKISEGLGLKTPVGHMDFYPNGGSNQPGCGNSASQAIKTLGFVGALRYLVSCDHFRSIEFFISSINAKECQPVAITCKDWESFARGFCGDCSDSKRCAVMGYHSIDYHRKQDRTEGRMFYVQTAQEKPYCLYQFQVILQIGGNDTQDGERMGRDEILLDMKTEGKLIRFTLNERNDFLIAGKTYTYLVTSEVPLVNVSSTFVSLASRTSGDKSAESGSCAEFLLRKMKIVPIALTKVTERNLRFENSAFCISAEETIERNQVLEVKLNLC